MKTKIKAEKKKKGFKTYLKAKALILDFLPFPSVKSITIE